MTNSTRSSKPSKDWNGEVINLQVTDAKEHTIELRALMSANSSGAAFDLRCEVREKLVAFLQREHTDALPRQRNDASLSEHRPEAPARTPKRRGRAVTVV